MCILTTIIMHLHHNIIQHHTSLLIEHIELHTHCFSLIHSVFTNCIVNLYVLISYRAHLSKSCYNMTYGINIITLVMMWYTHLHMF